MYNPVENNVKECLINVKNFCSSTIKNYYVKFSQTFEKELTKLYIRKNKINPFEASLFIVNTHFNRDNNSNKYIYEI